MNYRRPNNYYVWQKADWPCFKWEKLDVQHPLMEAKIRIAHLLGMMTMADRHDEQLVSLNAMTDNLVDSSAIEGQLLNADSVRSSLANRIGIELKKAVQPDHYTEGVVQATLDAVRDYTKPVTAERLFGWHAALFPTGYSGPHKITVANWRQGDTPMLVISGAVGHEHIYYEAPPSSQVPREMQDLLDWIANPTEPDPLLQAAIVHLWFVAIHPFDDGNGRIVRTLTDLMLCRHDRIPSRYYSLTTQLLTRRKEYYAQLEQATTHGMDITPWLVWFLGAVEAAVARTERHLATAVAKKQFYSTVEFDTLNLRQRKVLDLLFGQFEGVLTSSKYAKLCRCSTDTALRDINDLLSKDILQRGSEGGRNMHYELNENIKNIKK